jgi:hypothetical protein
MSDITVTSANVRIASSGALTRPRIAGGALTVGYAGYLDSNAYVQHADANAGETQSRGIGVIVASVDGETSIASGGTCSLCVFGEIEGFSDMTPGAPVYVSSTVGRLTHTAPTGGAYQRAIGYAMTATKLMVSPESGAPSSV